MRRLMFAGLVVVATVALIAALPTADAALPKQKSWKWVDDVAGDVQDVAICQGEACASRWATTATANTATGSDQANLYSHRRGESEVWRYDPEGDGDSEATFAMTSADIDGPGEIVLGASNVKANQGPLEDRKGPFYALGATGFQQRYAIGDDQIENADGSAGEVKLVRWRPGTQNVFAMTKQPASSDTASPRLWVYEVANSGGADPYKGGWGTDGKVLSGDVVDLAVTRNYVAVALSGGDAPVVLFKIDDPGVTTFVNSSTAQVSGTPTDIAVARDSKELVVGMDDGVGHVVRITTKTNEIAVTRVGQRSLDEAVDTVDISATGKDFAIGGSDGIRSYRITTDPNTTFSLHWLVNQSTAKIDMSQDGRYVTSYGSNIVRTYWNHPPTRKPVLLWVNSDISGVPLDIATGWDGSGVVVGTDASKVYYFDLRHGLNLSVTPVDQGLEPGENNTFELDVENAGDAVSRVRIDATSKQRSWITFQHGSRTAAAGGITLTLLPEEQATVKVHVRPPAGTSAGQAFSANLTATVRTSPGSRSESVKISGTVEESYGVTLTVDQRTRTIKQGGRLTYNLTVVNAGNIDDTIQLALGPTAQGWSATLGQTTFDLDAGASGNTTLTVRAPEQVAQAHTEKITVTGSSQSNPAETGSVTVVADVGRTGGVAIEAPASVTVRPGEANSVTVRINNTGNAANTFDLALKAPGNWQVTLSTESVTLAPGASRAVTMTITPPSEARGQATVTLTATAADDASIRDERTIVVDLDRGFLGLPGFGVQATVVAALVLLALRRRRR